MKRTVQTPLNQLLPACAFVSCMSPLAAASMPTTIRFPEVLFLANSAEPIPDSSYYFLDDHRINTMDEVIADMAVIMRDNPSVVLELSGHTDAMETDPAELGHQRARRIACALISVHGIESERLVVMEGIWFAPRISETEIGQMKGDNERCHARQLNRYVSFRITRFDWSPPIIGELAAVRFLSDPMPPKRNGQNFCDEPLAGVVAVENADTTALAETQDSSLSAVEVPEVVSTESPSVQLEALAPMIMPNPIVNDELNLVWLPSAARDLHIRMITLDGRWIAEQKMTDVEQGARLNLPVPASLASGTYMLRISSGSDDWSLRFVKP